MLASKTILFLVNLVHKLYLLIKFRGDYFFEIRKNNYDSIYHKNVYLTQQIIFSIFQIKLNKKTN